MWCVYILKSTTHNWHYVGSTSNLSVRFLEHNNGKTKSTKAYRPFRIIYTKKFTKESLAREYEHKIKDCRKEKERILKELNSEQSWEIV